MLPAIASLIDANLENNETLDLTTQEINELGETFYRVGQGLNLIGKGLQVSFRLVVGAIQTMVLKTAQQIEKVMSVASSATEALGLSSESLSNGLQLTRDFISSLESNMADNLGKIEDNADSAAESFKEMLDPKAYQGLSEGDVAAIMEKTAAGTSQVAAAATEAEEKVEDFTDQLIKLQQKATDTAKGLSENLSGAFKEFGDSVKSNFTESAQTLAGIVIGAEAEIERLRKAKKDDDLTRDERKAIKAEIKKQKEILKTREDFEERQAERIDAIRTQLEERGIDASKIGLDNLLNIRSLEEEIEEQRRVAGLNEFEKFEEEQSKKLLLLTDAFISEASLLQTKIDNQKTLEEELTTFLVSEDEKRLTNTEAWATQTIAKYGEVADSLRSLISTEQQLNSIRAASAIAPGAPGLPSIGNAASNSTTNNNSTNITAPVNISGTNVQNLSATEISAILGNELTKFIRN